MRRIAFGCVIVLLASLIGGNAICGDLKQSEETSFALPTYQKIEYHGVLVFKSCKEVSTDHPLRLLFSDGGPIYQLEFTDEYLTMKRSTEVSPNHLKLLPVVATQRCLRRGMDCAEC